LVSEPSIYRPKIQKITPKKILPTTCSINCLNQFSVFPTMSLLDSTPSSDELMSMESLKALVAANTARVARLCAAVGVQFDAPQESTPPPTPTLEPRHDAPHEDDNLDLTEAFASLPLDTALEFQPLTPTRCSTQCSPADAGVVTPASDRGTSPSTTRGSSWRPLQLDGDQDNRCIEANGGSLVKMHLQEPWPPLQVKGPMDTAVENAVTPAAPSTVANGTSSAITVEEFEDLAALTKDDEASITIIVVGASGDLAKKKIFPALFALYYEGCLPKHFSIFGYA
jgi:hypothetical protein